MRSLFLISFRELRVTYLLFRCFLCVKRSLNRADNSSLLEHREPSVFRRRGVVAALAARSAVSARDQGDLQQEDAAAMSGCAARSRDVCTVMCNDVLSAQCSV